MQIEQHDTDLLLTDILPLRLVTEQLFECRKVEKPLDSDEIHGETETS